MNKDPYLVLGVSRDADDAAVKKAYRELAKKFHPDNYANDEAFRELAEEKMKEINEAYDEIMKQRTGGSSGYTRSYGNGGGNNTYSNYSTHTSDTSSHASEYNQAREYINSGRIDEAVRVLNGIPRGERQAEWHFLYGIVCMRKGWNFEAAKQMKRACELDPGNAEYQSAYSSFINSAQQNSSGYSTGSAGNSGCGCSTCDICTGLLCADCCCECMGGDLIPCC